jgi:hypothetical protein
MSRDPREIACACGHVSTLASQRMLCIKCGKWIFYDEKEKRAHRYQSWYFTAIIVCALGFIAYFFVEMILSPLMRLE